MEICSETDPCSHNLRVENRDGAEPGVGTYLLSMDSHGARKFEPIMGERNNLFLGFGTREFVCQFGSMETHGVRCLPVRLVTAFRYRYRKKVALSVVASRASFLAHDFYLLTKSGTPT